MKIIINYKKERMNDIMKNRLIICTILLLLLMPIVDAIYYPKLTGYVNDFGNMINPIEEEQITQLAEKINRETTVEIAVVTVESLQGENIAEYATELGQRNGVGKKDKSNGLLILLAKNDRKYFVATGYGLEGVLPDATVNRINDNVLKPYLKKEEYGKGIYEEILVFEGFFTNNSEVVSKYGVQSSGDGALWIFLLAFGIIFIIIIAAILIFGRNGHYSSGSYGGGWGGGSGGGSNGGDSGGGSNGGGSRGGFGGGGFGGGGAGGGW